MEFKSLRGRVETCPFLFQPNLRENYREMYKIRGYKIGRP